ncbi:hypothetical protein ACO0LG_22535 [Undibacterium sp. Ji42W]|uniref:hypothetical protein n=1 Tax=Undibacterium sp. Ji42W TaxID=3413039 RepID=UPI003BF4176C
MRKRTWSYTDITKSAENGIAICMKLAEKALQNGNDDDVLHHFSFAKGQFAAWNNLTIGWQKEGDAKRLEDMTKIEGTDDAF